jgi:hypothetical protein
LAEADCQGYYGKCLIELKRDANTQLKLEIAAYKENKKKDLQPSQTPPSPTAMAPTPPTTTPAATLDPLALSDTTTTNTPTSHCYRPNDRDPVNT